MPEIIANARDTQPTVGTVFGAEHARSRRHMSVITVEAARFSIRDYHLNRGAFLPMPPALSLLFEFAGATSSPNSATWGQLADPGWALWDGGNAEQMWESLPGSLPLYMIGSSNALVEVVDDMPGTRSCTRKAFAVARTAPGATFTALVPQSRRAWLVAAVRVSGPEENGPLLSLDTLLGELAVRKEGAMYAVTMDELVVGRRPAGLADTQPLVIGIQIDNGEASVRIWDSGGLTLIEKLTMTDLLVATSFKIGGIGSPAQLVYMAGYGTDSGVGDRVEQVRGFLTC